MLRLRTLDGYLAIEVTTVLKVDVETLGILLHPSPVLIDIGGIDDEEEVVLTHLIHQQVVDSSTILVAHHTIIDLTHRGTSNIVGEDMLNITLGILALNRYLTHVRDIEESHFLAYCRMLRGDAGTLIEQWHVETSERHHRCS